jgi:hypothetical protein
LNLIPFAHWQCHGRIRLQIHRQRRGTFWAHHRVHRSSILYINVHVCVCVCVYIYIYIHACVHAYIHTYICVYIYTCTHTHTNTHTHTHTHTNRIYKGGLYPVPVEPTLSSIKLVSLYRVYHIFLQARATKRVSNSHVSSSSYDTHVPYIPPGTRDKKSADKQRRRGVRIPAQTNQVSKETHFMGKRDLYADF